MRSLVALAVLLLAATASAQDTMNFTEANQIRIGYGDLPSTDAVEADGVWNVEQIHVVNGEATLPILPGAANPVIRGSAGTPNATYEGDHYLVGTESEETFTITYSIGGHVDLIGGRLEVLADSHVFIYTSSAAYIDASQDPMSLPWPGQPAIQVHSFDEPSGALTFSVLPTAPATVGTTAPGFGLDAMSLLLGLVAGALVWALLVARGIVQKRTRKQIVSTAAHKDVASKESREALAGRKRLLMAALKELEMAKMNKEIDQAAYDSLKSDFKRQTVTVMRAIEEN